MAYTVFKHNQEYGARKGLEGPFHYPNGRVAYYDPKVGQYWDPRTDFYLEAEEAALLQNSIFEVLKRA
jgi:hypothetical protein